MFFRDSLLASLFSSFEIMVAFLPSNLSFLAIVIGYGEIPANITKILHILVGVLGCRGVGVSGTSLDTWSAMIFLSFESLGEK